MNFKEALKVVCFEGNHPCEWNPEFERDDSRPSFWEHVVCCFFKDAIHLSLYVFVYLDISLLFNCFICCLSSITPTWEPLMKR